MTISSLSSEERAELENLCAWLSTQKSDVFKNPHTILRAALNQAPAEPPPAMDKCPSCYGTGQWETECCNGADGCDCKGQIVPMGRCNVCAGTGQIRADHKGVNLRANCGAIAGRCFIGAGPTRGMWAGGRLNT